MRTVPGAAIRLERRVGHIGQGVMRGPSVEIRSRPVDGRPHQRMPEAHLRADVQQPGLRRRLDRRAGDPEPRRRTPHQGRLAHGLRRRDQEEEPGFVRQLLDTPEEAVLDPAREGNQLGHAEPAGQLAGGQPPWKLQQGQRIAPGLGHDPVPDAFIEPSGDDRLEEPSRVLIVQAVEQQLGQAGELNVLTGRADGEHHRHRLRKKPSGDEPQDLARSVVEPLRVIDEAEKRSFLRDFGDQGEGPQRHEEAIGWIAGRQSQRHPQGLLLGRG
jgi:hypothetical protein